MNERMYMVELYLPGTKNWVRSWSFNADYMKDEALNIVAVKSSDRFRFRATPLPAMVGPTVARKAYRRHTAVTYLELRGASDMLKSAQKHLIDTDNYCAWEYLYHAQIEVLRQQEAT
jgi:hypothetical protein